jgi:hypothetical protein
VLVLLAVMLLGMGVLLGSRLRSTVAAYPRRDSPPTMSTSVAEHGDSLRDVRGSRRSLEELRGASAVVLAFWSTDCPVANQYAPHLLEMYRRFHKRNVDFVLVYPNYRDTLDRIAAHALDHDIPFWVVKDVDQQLCGQLGVSRTPTVCVLDDQLNMRYRGRIDGRYGVGHRRADPGRNDLASALDEVLAHKPVSVAETSSDGCLLDRPIQVSVAGVTYSDQIGSILKRRCGGCHRPAGQAPFSLLTYDDAAQWSPMIREVVDQRRMPPWHADRRHGPYLNDRSLTPEEISQLLSWIDAGMPRGREEVEAAAAFTSRWSLNRVDAVIEAPHEDEVPAEGVLDYQYAIVPREVSDSVFDQDRWIQAIEVLPSNPGVVHHVQVNFYRPDVVVTPGWDNVDDSTLVGIVGWAPGKLEYAFPPGSAMRAPKGMQVMFEVHYTPNGRASRNRPALAIQFADSPPEKEVRTLVPFLYRIKIPPGEPHHCQRGQYPITQPTRLLSINPHMHLRGKAFHCDAVFPDGTRKRLLSVPRYDFNWQTFYWLAEPPLLPPGSQVEITAWWDNSRFNLNNPDPRATVSWGIQSTDEMMTCFLFGEVDRVVAEKEDLVAVPAVDLRNAPIAGGHGSLPLVLRVVAACGGIWLFWRLMGFTVRRLRRGAALFWSRS